MPPFSFLFFFSVFAANEAAVRSHREVDIAGVSRGIVLTFPVTGLGNLTLFEGDEPCAVLGAFCSTPPARRALDPGDCVRQLASHLQPKLHRAWAAARARLVIADGLLCGCDSGCTRDRPSGVRQKHFDETVHV